MSQRGQEATADTTCVFGLGKDQLQPIAEQIAGERVMFFDATLQQCALGNNNAGFNTEKLFATLALPRSCPGGCQMPLRLPST